MLIFVKSMRPKQLETKAAITPSEIDRNWFRPFSTGSFHSAAPGGEGEAAAAAVAATAATAATAVAAAATATASYFYSISFDFLFRFVCYSCSTFNGRLQHRNECLRLTYNSPAASASAAAV